MTTQVTARDKLGLGWSMGRFVCVGLDSRYEKLPDSVKMQMGHDMEEAIFRFNCDIVDATCHLALAYKPNIAFYYGEAGKRALQRTIQYIKLRSPETLIILDSKRGDIGDTNVGYVAEVFYEFGADAVTVNPYFGEEAIRPFLERTEKLIISLCRTSNPGAGEFQDMSVCVDGEDPSFFDLWYDGGSRMYIAPLYEYVAYRIATHWNKHNNCALVVGATYPEEVRRVRTIAPTMPFLLPGFGKQGAKVGEVIPRAMDANGNGFIANSSSGIIFASREADYAEAAHRETQKFHTDIARHREAELARRAEGKV